MKTTIITSLALCALLSGCHQPVLVTQPESVPESVAVNLEPTPGHYATPAPVVSAATPAPVETRYYLASPVSIETSDGLTGIPAGIRIEPLHGNVYLVSEREMALRPDQVTSDPDLAFRLRAREGAAQASIARQLPAPEPPSAQRAVPEQATPAPFVPHATGLGPVPQLGGVQDGQGGKASVTWHTDASGRQYHNGSYGRIYR